MLISDKPMYHRQQNKCYPQRCQIATKTAIKLQHSVMKFDRIKNLNYVVMAKIEYSFEMGK